MDRLKAVEDAKALLEQGKEWSIVKWLTEKRHVRRVADEGTAALDRAERDVKSTWTEDLRSAYAALTAPSLDDDPFAAAEWEFAQQQAQNLPPEIVEVARRVKAADDIATQARLTAEKTFDEAERRLSARLARLGAEQAIEAYEIRYKAIETAEQAR
jgi:hypothetical protein